MMNSPRPPQTMVTMLGLNRPSFRLAVASVMIAYVAVGLILPHLELSVVKESAAIGGSIGLAAALWLAARGDDDPIGLVPTVVAVLLGASSAGAVWWSIPEGPMNWVRPGAPFVVYTVITALVAIRGRVRWAWLGFALVIGTVVIAAVVWDWGNGIAAQAAVRMGVSLVPVTLVMYFVRPLLAVSQVLDRREVASVKKSAAHSAMVAQRRRQLSQLDDEVRPILEKLAAGESITAAEAERARLLEYGLRDAARGTGWISPAVSDAVADARRRGVEVRLFDDRGAGGSAFDVEPLRNELLAVLGEVDEGSLTARLLPRGRESVAVIAVQRGHRVRRRHCRLTAAGVGAWETVPLNLR